MNEILIDETTTLFCHALLFSYIFSYKREATYEDRIRLSRYAGHWEAVKKH